MKAPIELRPPEAQDTAFIVATWADCATHSRPLRHMPKAAQGAAKNMIRRLGAAVLKNSKDRALVACNPANRDQLYGWIAWRPGAGLHMLYVKAPFRGWGIGGALFAATFLDFPLALSTWTDRAERLDPGAVYYRPSLLSEAAHQSRPAKRQPENR